MKLTKEKLRQIIKEELSELMAEENLEEELEEEVLEEDELEEAKPTVKKPKQPAPTNKPRDPTSKKMRDIDSDLSGGIRRSDREPPNYDPFKDDR